METFRKIVAGEKAGNASQKMVKVTFHTNLPASTRIRSPATLPPSNSFTASLQGQIQYSSQHITTTCGSAFLQLQSVGKVFAKCWQSENAGPALPFRPPLSRMQTSNSRHSRHCAMENQCKSINVRHRPRRLSCHPNVYDFSELFEVLLALLPGFGQKAKSRTYCFYV